MGRSNVPQCWRGEMERGQRESPREECAGERRRRTRGRRRRRRERRRGRREMEEGEWRRWRREREEEEWRRWRRERRRERRRWRRGINWLTFPILCSPLQGKEVAQLRALFSEQNLRFSQLPFRRR